MSLLESSLSLQPSASAGSELPEFSATLDSIAVCFGVRFALLKATTGEYLAQGELIPGGDVHLHDEMCMQVLRRGQAEFIAEEDPVVLLAIPIVDRGDAPNVALAPFVIRAADEATIASAAGKLGFASKEATTWARRQTAWSAERLLCLANLLIANWTNESRQREMQREIDELSAHLSATYEELSLLYGLTQKLRISASIEELGTKALEWLAEAIPAEGFLLQLVPPQSQADEAASRSVHESAFLKFGQCPVDRFHFSQLLGRLDLNDHPRPVVINPASRGEEYADWPFAGVRQAVVVPLTEGENLFGWLATFNHDENHEFGSSEASLLSSVAAILGIHAGNIELYRQQAEFLAGVVRALTSAIDAKDPYTCGHSDRVARIAVKLADRLGCDGRELETIYLSGLLHDIGKIGIDDQVLRKPGKLTQAEYEHIKMHADIGYRILKDLKQLGQVLPVVRHHHEAWDGSGYPFGLSGEEIPLYARIVAVADAFDAMTSDRPYRRGMPDEKLDAVFKAGAGKQWDADVIEAFFAARDEIRRIGHTETDAATTELARLS
jgi:putative nucleotidyltransferase with HDIG domain